MNPYSHHKEVFSKMHKSYNRLVSTFFSQPQKGDLIEAHRFTVGLYENHDYSNNQPIHEGNSVRIVPGTLVLVVDVIQAATQPGSLSILEILFGEQLLIVNGLDFRIASTSSYEALK